MESQESNQAQDRNSTPPSPSPSEPTADELRAMIEAKRATMPKPPEPEPMPTVRIPRYRAPVIDPEPSGAEWEERRRNAERNRAWDALVAARGVRYEKCRLDNFRCDHEAQRVAVARLQEFVG